MVLQNLIRLDYNTEIHTVSRNLRVKHVENTCETVPWLVHDLCSCTLRPSIGGRHEKSSHASPSAITFYSVKIPMLTLKFRIYWTKCWENFEPTDTDRLCTLAAYLVGFASLQQSDAVAACSSVVKVAVNLDQYMHILTRVVVVYDSGFGFFRFLSKLAGVFNWSRRGCSRIMEQCRINLVVLRRNCYRCLTWRCSTWLVVFCLRFCRMWKRVLVEITKVDNKMRMWTVDPRAGIFRRLKMPRICAPVVRWKDALDYYTDQWTDCALVQRIVHTLTYKKGKHTYIYIFQNNNILIYEMPLD